MNLKQAAKLNMLNTLVSILNSYNSVWSANLVVSDAISNLEAYLNTLMLADGIKLVGTKGVTNTKNMARQALINFAFNHANAGKAYFTANTMPGEKQVCMVTKTDLVRTKTAELEPLCRNIYDAVQPYIANLALYGATPASLSTFNTALNNYHTLLGTTQAQRSITVAASLTVEEQIINIRELLTDTIDPLMVQYSSNSDFIQAYTNARHSTTVNVHHWLIIAGTIMDADNNPLPYALVKIVGAENHRKVTSENGKYRFVHLRPGFSYTIEVSASGYATQTAILTTDTAQTLQHNFVMVAAEG